MNPAIPLTMDYYLTARTITTPFGLYDCDVPCDRAVAVIVSALDVARDLAKPPVLVEAVGAQMASAQRRVDLGYAAVDALLELHRQTD